MGTARLQGWLALLLVAGGLVAACGSPTDPPSNSNRDLLVRRWSFTTMAVGATGEVPVGSERVQVGGTVTETMDFGPLILAPAGRGPIAKADVFGSEDGSTYWAGVEAPNPGSLNPGDVIGNASSYLQFQYFKKTEPNAELRLVVTQANLEGIDGNPGPLLPQECPWHQAGGSFADCRRVMWGWVDFHASAFSFFNQQEFFKAGGFADISGWRGAFDYDAYTVGQSGVRFWDRSSFEFDPDVDGTGGGHAIARLAGPITLSIPLASVPVGQEFYVTAQVKASALNHRQRESYLSSYLRDPAASHGLEWSYSGVEPVETPTTLPAPPPPLQAANCAGGSTGAGSIQFDSTAFLQPELLGAGATVLVSRTGGTGGMVSARLSTANGSAADGSDYSAVSTYVVFADGESGTRAVRIPIINDNTGEPTENLSVTLSEPAGCATLGSPSTATITILDDDNPIAPATYTLGGNVSGLTGSGLVLTNIGTNLSVGNGPFTFGLQYQAGNNYNVQVLTQPTGPTQFCTVANGAGTFTDHDVTDVAVTCQTPAPVGSLDSTYGTNGRANIPGIGAAIALALQSDGKAVVVGQTFAARFTTTGIPDSSFGGTGVVSVNFSGNVLDRVQGLALQADGKIVVVGFARVGTQNDFGLARLTTTGTLDGSFGTGGKVTTDFNGTTDQAFTALVQPDGKLVVIGDAGTTGALGLDNDFAVVRYQANGAIDSTFGLNGKVMTNIGGRTDLAYAGALQPDGKIVIGGRVADGGGDNPDVGLVRYQPSGSPDSAFGTAGIVRTDLAATSWDEVSELVLQPDGRILVSVQAQVGGTFDYMVARYTAAGTLDLGFGSGGVATVAFGTQNDFARSLALQADGSIVVVGNTQLTTLDFGVARLTSGGVLDQTFAAGGKLTVDFFNAADLAEAVAIQADGRIVVAGSAVNSGAGVGLVRIVP